MKKNILSLLLPLLFLTACSKQNATPAVPLNDRPTPEAGLAGVTGVFINGPHGTASGNAVLYSGDGKYTLALENLTVSNGPDLHVYLSKEIQPVHFIDLGKLSSIAGNQLYAIPGTPDFSVYQYALIHCQQYNHLFGSAALK